MVSLGVGGVAAGIAFAGPRFFKALLFLGPLGRSRLPPQQDIRKMGGLRRLMPVTFLTYAIGIVLSGCRSFFGRGRKRSIRTRIGADHPCHYLMMAVSS